MIFVPKEICVGYQNRDDTFTGRLAYVIYVDHAGKLRKEGSWQSWRSKDIEPESFENVPTEGFVFNKRAGGWAGSWGHDKRQDYVRVYDPRGIEFELTIPNVLYILENANCIKGKGLEGEFVYGWDGSDILLVPVGAPDYQEMIDYRDTLYNKETVKAKDLILGATYKHKNGKEIVYLGRYEAYADGYYSRAGKARGKAHFFRVRGVDSSGKYSDDRYLALTSISGVIIKTVDSSPAMDYAELMDELEGSFIYSPMDESQDRYTPVTVEELEEKFANTHSSYVYVFGPNGNCREIYRERNANGTSYRMYPEEDGWRRGNSVTYNSLEEIIMKVPLFNIDKYLQNGRFCYRREY